MLRESSQKTIFFQIIQIIRKYMRWNKKYNYPSSSRAMEDGIRRYLLGEVKLPGVTSILDATKSNEEKAALRKLERENWT